MKNANKPRHSNPYHPFSFDDFPPIQPLPRDRRSPPLVGVHALIVGPDNLKKNISIHLALFVMLVAGFYAAGLTDKARLDASDADTRNAPLFSHRECYFLDGGSVSYDSFAYSAFESRRLEDVMNEDGRVLGVRSAYQGYTWKWRHLNTLWIAALLAVSYLIVSILLGRKRNSAQQDAP